MEEARRGRVHGGMVWREGHTGGDGQGTQQITVVSYDRTDGEARETRTGDRGDAGRCVS